MDSTWGVRCTFWVSKWGLAPTTPGLESLWEWLGWAGPGLLGGHLIAITLDQSWLGMVALSECPKPPGRVRSPSL